MMNWTADTWWMIFGLAAQVPFFLRFVVQWIASERRRESIIPVGFWYLSIVGGVMLTVYTLFRHPILAPCQAAGLIVYVRNLVLIRRTEQAKAATAASDVSAGPIATSNRQAA